MMKRFKTSIFYVVTIGGFCALMYWLIRQGAKLEAGKPIVVNRSDKGQWADFLEALVHNLEHPLAILLAQIVTIIFVARILGWVCRKIGQPSVIGEIVAGIILGPSLIGHYLPGFSAALFPAQSLGNLQFLSQIGLILFMFVVGMELDLRVLKNRAQDAVVISHASIVFPFALGMGLAYFLYDTYAPKGVQFLSFGLFLGIAMSITAFPVLARIVQERGLHKTRLGTIVITCAAADDITAWSMLAAVIAIVKAGSFVSSLYVIGMAVIYLLVMLKVVRPFLRRIGELHSFKGNLSKTIVAIFFLTLILSSYATEIIGIHALFGAFMAGAIMPGNVKFRTLFIEKVEDVALVLLLPLFFVYTGLRTQIGLLNDIELWKITGIIVLVAVVGKFLGSALTAKFVGQTWKDSLTIGALMNTRGLMELIVLNIGYDLGVLTPEIFAMSVIMALVTTLMTGPALNLINWIYKSKSAESPPDVFQSRNFKVLISFANPDRGRSLLRLANAFTRKQGQNASVTTMHLTPSNEVHQYNIEEYERERFAPIIEESKKLKQQITTLFKASNDIDSDIAQVANAGNYDLLLIGEGQSIFEGTLLGRILGFTTRLINPDRLISQVKGKEKVYENSALDERTRQILSKCEVPVGVLLDKELAGTDRVIIPLLSPKDQFLLAYALRLIHNAGSQVTILDSNGVAKANSSLRDAISALEQIAPGQVNFLTRKTVDKGLLSQQSLMLVSIDSWKKLVDTQSLWLSDIPSALLLADRH